jgi:hypothetical protein
MNATVTTIGLDELADAEQRHKMVLQTGCYTKKAADVINAVLHWAVQRLRAKNYYYRHSGCYDNDCAQDKVGGGIIVKTLPDIFIDPYGEVRIMIGNGYALRDKCRVAANDAERISTFNAKLAYSLKQMWKVFMDRDKGEKNSLMNYCINPTKEATEENTAQLDYNEYRTLYEHLMGRSHEKTKSAYGNEAFNLMIGTPMDDQLMRSMVETIQAEMQKVRDELSKKMNELQAEESAKVKEIRTLFESKRNIARAEAALKEKKLKDEMKAMLTASNENAAVAAAG